MNSWDGMPITPFPSDIANHYATKHEYLVKTYKSDAALPKSISNSQLCHVSAGTWCRTAGFASKTPERAERCGRLTGDVAAKAAALLNDYFQGKFTASNLKCHLAWNVIPLARL